MHKILNVALIAHDKKKDTLVSFCIAYEGILAKYGLSATGTPGKRIMAETNLDIHRDVYKRQGKNFGVKFLI